MKADRDIEERCRQFLQTFEHRLKTLEDKSEKFVTADDVKHIIAHEVNSQDKPPLVIVKKDNALSEDIIREMNDREKRKNNFVIFRAPELNTNVKQERIAYDLKVVKEIGTHIGVTITEEDVIRTSRLGKKPEDKNESNRPLLVSLSNEHVKKNLFKNLSKLRDVTGYLAGLSVDHDMTPKEREETKTMQAEAKTKEEKSAGKFIYRVRGPPWNRYIKKMSKNDS